MDANIEPRHHNISQDQYELVPKSIGNARGMSSEALQILASAAEMQQQVLSQSVPALGKPRTDGNKDFGSAFDSITHINSPSYKHAGADNTLQHPEREIYDSDCTLSNISESDFVEFDVETLDLEDLPSSKKRKRSGRKGPKIRESPKDVSEDSAAAYVRSREELFTNQSGDPISVFTDGHPFQQTKPGKFATLDDLSGELMNTVYKWWSVSQFQHCGVTGGSVNRLARRCVAPPDPSFLRTCKKVRTEATAKFYANEISRCQGIYFKDTMTLYNFLICHSKDEVKGLTAAWVNYDSNIIDLGDRAGPYNHYTRAHFRNLDGSPITSIFYQIDTGPQYAYDAFHILAWKCRKLDTLVINRSLDGPPLTENYPGVWKLRSLRRLERFRFEGAAAKYRDLNRVIRKEVVRRRDRSMAEYSTPEAMRLWRRDSEHPWLRIEGAPSLLRWAY